MAKTRTPLDRKIRIDETKQNGEEPTPRCYAPSETNWLVRLLQAVCAVHLLLVLGQQEKGFVRCFPINSIVTIVLI